MIDINWNPHDPTQIVSASADGTLQVSCHDLRATLLIVNVLGQVWNAQEGTALVNLREHHGRVLACAWSRVEVNVIFSGGDDQTVRRWDLSAQSSSVFRAPPEPGSHLI